MAERQFRDTHPSAVSGAVQALAARAFARSSALRRRARNAGEVADFIDWQTIQFGRTIVYSSRERLWSSLANRMEHGRSWHGIEFGVAWGYATNWWLRKLPPFPRSTWDGFDRFTGLPQAWREYGAGAFDNRGIPPAINDERLTWHVGDVETTTGDLDTSKFSDGGRLVLFDLDLYAPTATAWQFVQPLLQHGDLLYFDEAMDGDERRVLSELVLPSGDFEYLGCTSLGLALKVNAQPRSI
jgi:hypothetical protein